MLSTDDKILMFPELVKLLQEARLQLEYLDERFATGTTQTVLLRINALLAEVEK